jgi:SAM-dependent methyltransferase
MATIHVSIDLPLEAPIAFEVVVEELAAALTEMGLHFEPGAAGGILDGPRVAGTVTSWKAGGGITLGWRQAEWAPEAVTEIELRFEPHEGGTRVVVEHRGWGGLIGDSSELAGWFTTQLVAPLLRATAPRALGDWITDRRARRPSGAAARTTYGDPLYHYPNFRVILNELALTAEDYLLEVGCGGGAFLHMALKSGCRAAAVDHSADMVRVAREVNRDSVDAGRLNVEEASASALPFPDAVFTCAAMTGVLGFLPDPVAVLSEIRRVLLPGGRLVLMGTDPELRDTPAAPEPIASRLRFYDEDELAELGRAAGFADVRVVRREMLAFAREAGVPEAHLPLFAGPGARFLLARKA